jgi:hypothetical protein
MSCIVIRLTLTPHISEMRQAAETDRTVRALSSLVKLVFGAPNPTSYASAMEAGVADHVWSLDELIEHL